ncbi:MAG: sigma-54-dependent Fis family transcriptional regulator [Planctomycetes bacterium]|nr:sigma-54-dependent Fis family transcriptional regulator [Planctomycetota bacterium]
MPKPMKWQEFMQLLLEHASRNDGVQAFFEGVLPVAQSVLGCEAIAVVQAAPPEWIVLASSGVSSAQVPTSLAADALDSESLTNADHWSAVPMAERYALLVRSVQDEESLDRLQSAFSKAFKIVQGQERRLRRIRRLEKILSITHTWSQTDCMESLLQEMAEAATELLAADRASIFLWDKANKTLVGRPALGVEGGELRIPDDAGIVGQVVQSGEPRRIARGLDEDQISRTVDQETGYHTDSLLCVPLNTPNGKSLGAFEVLNSRDGRFSDEDEQGLLELATHAAVALENTKQLEDLLKKHQLLVEEAAEGVCLIGESPAIEAVRSTTRRIADTDLAILILGENGTGKEVVAQSIHYLSSRREQPFIAVNCAALSETLLESELFGHEKGAFTDAHQTRAGKFELASGGTLFLDEIGDMSLSGQSKLLRVLEDKMVVRVGGSTPIHTGVRILAATNQDLAAMVREKRFREDLFFRLNVVSLELPPLRGRGNDVILLAEHFLQSFCKNMGRKTPRISSAAKKQLLNHAWPGNVRELRNQMERLAYLTSGDCIETEDLSFIDTVSGLATKQLDMDSTLTDATREFQQQYISQMVEHTRGNMSKAAKCLGLHRSNLYRKMRQLDMGGTDVDVDENTED